ncbi:uncharacterized protein LOC131153705 [Malania oleifera]|uniref:uncharacterized protein LOC131153705 n=1 Tax=Malania oleifera TaxID=397392 RepID=UPI0025AEB0A9|nr:uncharacterized protein LOC131153705 [Malania oleifera]
MAEITRSSRERGGPSSAQRCTIEKFMKMNPPAFSRATNPAVAENWVQEIEKILTVLYCTDEQRVLYAMYRLAREAERWWAATRLLEEQKAIPEFLSLSQGSLTIPQYAARFIELSRFCPYVVPNEAKKVRMFERNLRRDIYRQVAVLRIQDFTELVDKATIAKESLSRETETQTRSSPSLSLSFSQLLGEFAMDRETKGAIRILIPLPTFLLE